MKYRLEDLIDIEQFQSLQDRLNSIYSFPSSIIDNEGNILTATAWQDICTRFHRRHRECEKECIKSDRYILEHLSEANPAVSYRCPHGLIDNATPIMVEGKHLGNFFTGQFFLEEPDLDFFRKQAARWGFDEETYIEAVKKVPIWTQEQLNHYLFFIKGLIEVITSIALKKLRTIESQYKLEEIEEKHRTILQTAMDGFYMADLEGRILQVNDAYCRMSGYAEPELLSMSIADLEGRETREEVERHIKKIMMQGEDRFETQQRHKDGSLFFVEVSAQYRATNGSGHFVAFMHDITARKRAEEEKSRLSAQLQQAQKMESIGRLAGGVAHDFNNMLGVILGHVEIALDQVDSSLPLHQNLVEIAKAAKRSSNLTRQLLAFARKQAIAPRILNLNETIAGTVKMLECMIGEHITLRLRPSQDLWNVKFDPSQIDQILANLCVNARDAIADVGEITIETGNWANRESCGTHQDFLPGEYVRLTVRDTGCGMTEEILSHVFEPFFTTKEVGTGTGLGLATVYGIVKQNGGLIDVRSTPGKGTAFTVYFPRHPDSGPEPRTGEIVSKAGGKTILLVEDEPALLKLTSTTLQRQDHTVLPANTPEEAIRIAAEHAGEIDLLMTDVIMPQMNGRNLARTLLSLCPRMRCLFMSGYTADIIAHSSILDEGLCFIQKPFSSEQLASKVREALES